MRSAKIPGVPLVMAQTLTDTVNRDATGKVAETLRKTPQGKMLLASSERVSALGDQQAGGAAGAAGGPPIPQAPPVPQAMPQALPRGGSFGQPSAPALALPGEVSQSRMTTTGNATAAADDAAPAGPAQDPADVCARRQHIAALFHVTALQKNVIDQSQKIVDAASLAKNANLWASTAKMWQSREDALEDVAGLEFTGDDAARYLETKETSDRQRAQIFAEFERLEKLGLLPKLNGQLVKQGGKAVGTSGNVADDDQGKPAKRSRPPPALKRVRSK